MIKKRKCRQCPRCGSKNAELKHVERKSLLFDEIIGLNLVEIFMRWTLAISLFTYYDIWAYLVKKLFKKGYIWKSKRILSTRIKYYYCPDCFKEFKE